MAQVTARAPGGAHNPLQSLSDVVDRSMDVARGHGVADPVEQVSASLVGDDLIGRPTGQSLDIHRPAVARPVLERMVEFVRRHGPVLDHDVIDDTLDGLVGILVPQARDQPVALAPDRAQLEIRRQRRPAAVERAQIGREVGGTDLERQHAVGRDHLEPHALVRQGNRGGRPWCQP